MSFDRDGLEDRLDPSALRERLDDLYARYFLPPSVTEDAVDVDTAMGTVDDADDEAFDFGAWLGAGRATGPTAPPVEPRVVTEATETARAAEPTPDDYDSFDFTAWLSAGEAFEPVAVFDPAADTAAEANADPAAAPDRTLLQGPSLHPVKAATFALFLSVAALVGLTVVGYLPALGPASGLGP